MHVGQKVECVRDYSEVSRMVSASWSVTLPIKGAVYTIRQFIIIPGQPDCILLNELSNPDVTWTDGSTQEAGFFAHDFRPITDISSLVKLTKVRQLEDA